MQESNNRPAQGTSSQQCRIKRAEFITSLAQADEHAAGDLPEIAVVGKSNVGKSSLINVLARNGKLARVSAEPGKTRLINLYRFMLGDESEFALVDLPGYGFARASQTEKQRWAGMIEGYLEDAVNLRHAYQLVDIRHEPTEGDRAMVEYMRHYGIEFSVIATKCDKISRAARSKSVHAICRALQVQPWEVRPFSSVSGEGMDGIVTQIVAILKSENS